MSESMTQQLEEKKEALIHALDGAGNDPQRLEKVMAGRLEELLISHNEQCRDEQLCADAAQLIAAAKASTALSYTVALRDKFIEAYKEIMQIQI